MRVFVLSTGRSGSKAIVSACRHITNYTAAHESLAREFGDERFNYPDNHIESDNRLTWHLGQLEERFGKDAFYVHLKRDRNKIAKSYFKRYYMPVSIVDAFCEGIRMTPPEKLSRDERYQASLDYIDTVTSNVELFLKDKPHQMTIRLEDMKSEFPTLWERIGAEGDLEAAVNEFDTRHNRDQQRNYSMLYRLKLFLIRETRHLRIMTRELSS